MTRERTNYDPKRCKAEVYESLPASFHQCYRKPKHDGWCEQHHPDTAAARQKQSQECFEKRLSQTPLARLCDAREEIVQLKAENARLKARIAEIGEPSDADT